MIKNDDIVIILGNRGMGKSTLANHIISKFNRTLIFDATCNDYNIGEICYYAINLYNYVNYPKVTFKPKEDINYAFNFFTSFILKTQVNRMILVDEIEQFASKHKINPNLAKLVRWGRHANLGFIFVSKTTSEIHNLLLSQANHLFCFKIHLPNQLEYLSKWIGKEIINKIRNLQPHYFIYYNFLSNESYISKLQI